MPEKCQRAKNAPNPLFFMLYGIFINKFSYHLGNLRAKKIYGKKVLLNRKLPPKFLTIL